MNIDLSSSADLLAISYIKWEKMVELNASAEQLKPILKTIEYYKEQVAKEIIEALRPTVMNVITPTPKEPMLQHRVS
jgi:hypothetical protein